MFQWFKDGQLLEDSENIRLMNGKDLSIIIIDPVGYNSEGNFTCKAITDKSSTSHSAMLQIQGNCIFTDQLFFITVHVKYREKVEF